jgi:hypothetical protein
VSFGASVLGDNGKQIIVTTLVQQIKI